MGQKKGFWEKTEQTQGTQHFPYLWLLLPPLPVESLCHFCNICLVNFSMDLSHTGHENNKPTLYFVHKAIIKNNTRSEKA